MDNIINSEPPLNERGEKMVRFETRLRAGKNGVIEQAIFIGGEHLDWSVDVSSLLEARKMGPAYFRVVQQDIERHFVESVSDFIGRKVSVDEVRKATKSGWI